METYLNQIKRDVETIESNMGWPAFYQMIKNESLNHDFSCSHAKDPSNKLLNRYRDVSPFDHSRVVLTNGVCNYINASLVTVNEASRNYILTQGPLPGTAGHFWLMVWEQNSKAILMLNKIIENRQIKCHQYWPVGSKNGGGDVMEFPDVGIQVKLISEDPSKNFIVRKLRVADTSTGNEKEVLQFHYTTWPDFAVPSSPRAFLHFLQVVRDSGALNQGVGPPVVHCSAGIGRSGTFCLVDSCLLMMEDGSPVNVKDILLKMRQHRMGLIQTCDQLKFSYSAICEGIKQMTEGHKRFIADQENGDLIETDERPLPPRRIGSLSVNPTDKDYQRLIDGSFETPSRPLPEPPSSDDESDTTESSERSLSDEIEDEDDSKEDSILESNSSSNNVSNEANSVNSVSFPAPEESVNLSAKTNGVDVTAREESSLRRRVKNDALRDKIRVIKAHQKESEAIRGIYRSPKPKRRKESVAVGEEDVVDVEQDQKESGNVNCDCETDPISKCETIP